MILKVATVLLAVTNILALPKQKDSFFTNNIESISNNQPKIKRQSAGPGNAKPLPQGGYSGGGGGGYTSPEGYDYPQPQQPAFQIGSTSFGVSRPSVDNFRPSFDARPQIHKHIYVHVAPPEPQTEQKQIISQTSQPQKHYKIIFIKAPSYSYQSQTVLPALQQNQEKTLIYVLVKKPEELGEIKLPEVKPTQPSKPEVYFIKYKTQKQTQQVGTGTSSVGNSFTGTSSVGNSFTGTSNFGGNSYLPPTSSFNTVNPRPNQPSRPVYGPPQ